MNEARDDSERALRELIAVLQLEKAARAAADVDELKFIMANDTRRAVPYDQAVFWTLTPAGNSRVRTVSGISQPDPAAPHFQHLHRVLDTLVAEARFRELRPVGNDDVPDARKGDWEALRPANPLWCPLPDADGTVQAGLWLTRAQPWQKAETTRLGFLLDAYAHTWSALNQRRALWQRGAEGLWRQLVRRRVRYTLLAAVIAVMFLPVSQTVVAPAEVVAQQPFIVSPPVDGVVDAFHVQPNEAVQSGQLLFSLDDRVIRNRNEVALKALEVARADYRRALNKSFTDQQAKAEVTLLKAVVDQKAAEVDYTRELLERIQVRAPREGIAVYSDPNDWLGRPVAVGEKIITLADPQATELLIWLAVDDAIALEAGADVQAFLNVDPTRPLHATLRRSSYEAQVSPEDVLAFQLRAAFDAGIERPRIGLKATAKIYGERVSLFYYMFRRPLSALRRALSW